MTEQQAIEAIKSETLGSMEAAYRIVIAYKAQKAADLARSHADFELGLRAETIIRESNNEAENTAVP